MHKIKDDVFAMWRKKPSKKQVKEMKREQDLVYCPHCNHLNQYLIKNMYNTRTCPYCKKFFVPANCDRRRRIDFTQWDSPTEWEEI